MSTQQWFGVYLGKVSQTRADLWVKAQVPQVLGQSVTNWARPMGFNTGSPPTVGSFVLVHFVGGDINHPAYSLTDQKTG